MRARASSARWRGSLRKEAPWRAALVGGLAGGVGGALTNDSGPVLFINAVLLGPSR